MTALLPILLICIIAIAIYRWRIFHLEALPAWTSVALFSVKLLFGFALWAVYTFYYTDRSTSDIYKFYDDAHYVHTAFGENKTAFVGLMTGSEDSSLVPYTSQMKNWQRNFTDRMPFNENRFMIRLNALMMFISFENIHVHTILFCLFSFIGCILLLKVFQAFLSGGKKKWVLLTVLFPSFLFWTSGGLKESIIMLGLGMLFYGLIFFTARKVTASVSFLMGVLLLFVIKYFLLLCIVPALVGYYLFSQRSTWQVAISKYAAILILSATALVIIAPLNPKLDFIFLIAKKQKHAIAEAKYLKAGSYSPVPVLDQSLFSIIKNLPTGLWNSMLKPYLWQSRNPMMLLSAAENIALLFLLIFAIVYRNGKETINYNILFFILTAVIPYLCMIGIMTPVLGNLVRYKVVVIPMLVFIALYIVDEQRISRLMKRQ
ncbi:MAG: hypothetical protein JWO03_778 [Bacteroidetes bacterium]|nr:hypothetical protein [Bacteroidota bacterium]